MGQAEPVSASSALSRGDGRYRTLDAMRGVAALTIVAYHFALHLGGYYTPESYLAVDLFFVISGFVIATAYDKRFAGGMSVQDFMVRRFKRLGPLFLLGAIIGAVALLLTPVAGISGLRLVVASALNALGLPSPFVTPDSKSAFPLNRPFWSLFYEVWIANLGFAIFWKQLGKKTLLTIVAASAVGVIFAEWKWHTLQYGFSWNTAEAGFARVLFSFFMGVLIARFHEPLQARLPRVPAFLCLVITAALLLAPVTGKLAHLYELACVLIAFPGLVLVGAYSVERRPWLGQLLGDTSYAAYTIHYPPVLILAAFAERWHPPHRTVIQVAFVIAIGALAWLAAKADEAFRRRMGWLPKKPPPRQTP